MRSPHGQGRYRGAGAAVITVCCLAALLYVLPATSARADDTDTITVHGRVLYPTGQPLADATISTFVFRAEKPFSRTQSAKDGSFEITFHKSDARRGSWFEQWTETVVMASRPGFGPPSFSDDDQSRPSRPAGRPGSLGGWKAGSAVWRIAPTGSCLRQS